MSALKIDTKFINTSKLEIIKVEYIKIYGM